MAYASRTYGARLGRYRPAPEGSGSRQVEEPDSHDGLPCAAAERPRTVPTPWEGRAMGYRIRFEPRFARIRVVSRGLRASSGAGPFQVWTGGNRRRSRSSGSGCRIVFLALVWLITFEFWICWWSARLLAASVCWIVGYWSPDARTLASRSLRPSQRFLGLPW